MIAYVIDFGQRDLAKSETVTDTSRNTFGVVKTSAHTERTASTPMNVCLLLQSQVVLVSMAIGLCTSTIQAQSLKDDAELRIGTQPVNRILFLGNSITLHAPAESIGWTGNWGMAASAEEHDYVHRLTRQIEQAAGGKPKVMVRNIADFERGLGSYDIHEQLKKELSFRPDIVVLAIGENIATPESDDAKKVLSEALGSLLAAIEKSGKPRIFVRSQFWADPIKDGLLKAATLKHQHVWIDLSSLIDESCYARSERKIEHAGVAGHPGDKGMQVIADAIMKAIVSEWR